MGAEHCLDRNQPPNATVVTSLATSQANWETDVHSESLLMAFLGSGVGVPKFLENYSGPTAAHSVL